MFKVIHFYNSVFDTIAYVQKDIYVISKFPPFGEATEFFFFRFEDLSVSKSTLGCYSDRVLLLMAQSSARNL